MEEFRIGNFIVDYETEPYYFQIEEIKKNEQGNLACYYRKGSCWSISPNRIELTEEIYREIENQLIKKGFSYGFDNGKITLYLSEEWEFECEFLNQLQNLYFALCGEELTL